MIEEILPSFLASADVFGDAPDVALFPEEEALVARAGEKRQRQFAAGRGCARQALAALGVPPAPLLRGGGGAPRWPDGVVGSITHCAGYAAAAVARADSLRGVGVDAEPDLPLPALVFGAVTLPCERDMLAALAAADPGVSWDRLLFSAKKAVYKAWFPLTRQWLGFPDARIAVHAGGMFSAVLRVPWPPEGGPPPAAFGGRWLARDGLIVTAVTAQ
ncbi:MAG TPA: 4'-phosphopantetheinyl transferase superfamily protein [Trebonia sp.]|nr:4'-phosphopantetheinyl transferase superfamily protein [Trebonia sp.]